VFSINIGLHPCISGRAGYTVRQLNTNAVGGAANTPTAWPVRCKLTGGDDSITRALAYLLARAFSFLELPMG